VAKDKIMKITRRQLRKLIESFIITPEGEAHIASDAYDEAMEVAKEMGLEDLLTHKDEENVRMGIQLYLTMTGDEVGARALQAQVDLLGWPVSFKDDKGTIRMGPEMQGGRLSRSDPGRDVLVDINRLWGVIGQMERDIAYVDSYPESNAATEQLDKDELISIRDESIRKRERLERLYFKIRGHADEE